MPQEDRKLGQDWRKAGWFLGGVALVAYVGHTTPTPAPFLIVIGFILLASNEIIGLLRTQGRSENYEFVLPDRYVVIDVDGFSEDEFQFNYLDDWQIGRGFTIYGSGHDIDATGDENVTRDIIERASIRINPARDWPQTSVIGRVVRTESGFASCYLSIPYALAWQALQEVRRPVNWTASVGFSGKKRKDGTIVYQAINFDLKESNS
jgi:hypothetical protein